jgi:hypothetical protein
MTDPTPAPGETSLTALLTTLKTSLNPQTFVFVTLQKDQILPSLNIQMLFHEVEGTTIITTQESASSHSLEYTFPCKMITLNIHSSLEAVGFIAAVSAKLTEKGIGVNPVSGFFHDHCFVPVGREEEAMNLLEEMAEDARKRIGTELNVVEGYETPLPPS